MNVRFTVYIGIIWSDQQLSEMSFSLHFNAHCNSNSEIFELWSDVTTLSRRAKFQADYQIVLAIEDSRFLNSLTISFFTLTIKQGSDSDGSFKICFWLHPPYKSCRLTTTQENHAI